MSIDQKEKLYHACNLRQRNIRLLDLDPSCAEDDELLQGTLRIASLDANPAYEALSYTWGSDKDNPSCKILCSGITIPITKNCYDALHNLTKTLKLQTIWIDAICINQKDNNEKSHQISLMRDIYGKAKRVLIWLGDKTDESDEAIDWVKYAARNKGPYSSVKMRSFPGMMSPPEILKIVKLVPEHIGKYHLLSPIPKRKCTMCPLKSSSEKMRLSFSTEPAYNPIAMADLVDREWFTRMWTIQELVMANEPFIVCGDKSTRWSDLSCAIIDAFENQKDKTDANLIAKFKTVLTGESFWLDLYTKSELSEARVRKWVQRNSIHGRFWHGLLDFLEKDNIQWLGHAQNAILATVAAQWMLTNERPFISIDPPKRLWFFALTLSRVVASFITPAIPSVAQGARETWDQNLREKLPGVLNLLRSRDATDQRDKVFALYGVFEELGLMLPAADWKKPLEQVYFEFTCAFLKWHKSLELLREVSQDRFRTVPSWVPDLSKPHQRISGGNYNAAGGSPPNFTIIDSAKHPGYNGRPRIISQAIIIATITHCITSLQPIPKNEDPLSPTSPPFLNTIRTIVAWLSLSTQPRFYSFPFNAEESKATAIFRLFHTHADFAVQERTPYREEFQRWLAVMKNYVPSQPHSSSATVEVAEECAHTLLEDEKALSTTIRLCSTPQALFIAASSSKTPSSSSISTPSEEEKRIGKIGKKKDRLGTAPPHTRAGDVIALLTGVTVPFVLRKVGSKDPDEDGDGKGVEEGGEMTYKVVGACYLEEVMWGEGWPGESEAAGVGSIILV